MEAKITTAYEEFENGKAGDVFLSESLGAYLIKCPGCSMMLRLPIKQNAGSKEKPWDWNGDLEKPTLSPSIFHVKGYSGCGWHGWLRNGVFKEC